VTTGDFKGNPHENSPESEVQRANAIDVMRQKIESAQQKTKEAELSKQGNLEVTLVDNVNNQQPSHVQTHIESKPLSQEELDQLNIPAGSIWKELRDWCDDYQLKILTILTAILISLEVFLFINGSNFKSLTNYLAHLIIGGSVVTLGFYIWKRNKLDKSSLLNPRVKQGWTNLIIMAKKGRIDIVRLLLEHGVNIDAVNEENATALMWATQKGHIDIVKFLLEQGADFRIKSKKGATALGIAERMNNKAMLQLLKRADTLKRSRILKPLSNLASQGALQLGVLQGAVKKSITQKINALQKKGSS
jgi:hypothetical protein